ncbi:hypothetical protein L3X38_003972 [Prunus dulcis]|uniref:Transposable element protein n=1 Tax=Prunus dulcis TaxID=3755 RepID=A0AAD4ZN50_PRUDU|nr:hypothetical protein L3X38_003972 [Prunus dulcis]
MDAYSGYNQIMMHEDIFHHRKRNILPKSNVLWAEERCSNLPKAGEQNFQGANRQDYGGLVDNMLVKAPERADHVKNLAEAFSVPSRVLSGRFLGYLVTQRGIKAHSNQINAILNMKSPTTTK